MTLFEIWCLECYFPSICYIITFFFLLKSYDILYRKRGVGLKDFISLSIALCRTQLLWLGYSQNLIELSWWYEKKDQSSLSIAAAWTWKGKRIKNSFSCMNRAGDNNDFWNITEISGLVNPAPNSKQFCFQTCDVDHIMKYFDKRSVVNMCVQYRCRDIIFDISIYDNKST